MLASAPEGMNTARRGPVGAADTVNSLRASTRRATESTLITPARSKSASYTASSPMRAPVCDWASTAPGAVRPVFKTTTGTSRSRAASAARTKAGVSAIPSTCAAIAVIRGSSANSSIKSLARITGELPMLATNANSSERRFQSITVGMVPL